MNCCNHNNQNNNNNGHKHSRFGHMCMMLLCCGAPIILLAIVSILGPSFAGIRYVAPLLCPIMMAFMIPMMMRKEKSNGNENNCCENQNQKTISESAEETKLLK